MIWIATLCLLAIAAWLFFNALNERRWVQAHSHDETVASDEGLLPNFTALTRSGKAAAGGLISMDQENSRVASAISKVQEKTTDYGDKLKTASSKLSQSASESDKLAEGKAALGTAVSKVSEKTADYGGKLKAAGSKLSESEKLADGKVALGNAVAKVQDKTSVYGEKLKEASNKIAQADGSKLAEGKAMLGQATQNVTRKSAEMSQRVVSQAKNKAQTYNEARGSADEGGMFGKVVGKVSGGLEKLEQKVDAKLARNRAAEEGVSSDDLVSRVADKVDSQIKNMDGKMADAGTPSPQNTDKTV
ncbi:MAG: hypothetical protein AB8B79_04600 [Granulosicoccus sp.]